MLSCTYLAKGILIFPAPFEPGRMSVTWKNLENGQHTIVDLNRPPICHVVGADFQASPAGVRTVAHDGTHLIAEIMTQRGALDEDEDGEWDESSRIYVCIQVNTTEPQASRPLWSVKIPSGESQWGIATVNDLQRDHQEWHHWPTHLVLPQHRASPQHAHRPRVLPWTDLKQSIRLVSKYHFIEEERQTYTEPVVSICEASHTPLRRAITRLTLADVVGQSQIMMDATCGVVVVYWPEGGHILLIRMSDGRPRFL